jgi:predicted MPP superfamily phosphohydrolase
MQFNTPMMLDLVLVLPMALLGAIAFTIGFKRKDALTIGTLAVLLSLVYAVITGIAYGDIFAIMRGGCWALFVVAPLLAAALAMVPRMRFRWLYAAVAVVIIGVGIDAFIVEPVSTVLTRYELQTDKLHAPIRIAVLTDIQTDHVGAHERAAIRMAMEAKPDLILLPGDYVQHRDMYEYRRILDDLRVVFAEEQLGAPMGVYAVRGNVDHNEWTNVFDGLPVRASDRTQVYQRPPITVTALSFRDGFNPDLHVPEQAGFHIAFAHGPDFSLGDIHADLLVAGHTHGGQVQLPFIGPLVTFSDVPRQHAHGMTTLPSGASLVVSRGIGMERDNAPRLRFYCRPEVVIIDLVPNTAK